MKLVTAEQMKQLESLAMEHGQSEEQLMEYAGVGLMDVIKKELFQIENPEIVFLCGNGNNGGDGFVAARELLKLGYKITICLVCGVPKTITAYSKLKQLKEWNPLVFSTEPEIKKSIKKSNLIVDAVYGLGFHGTLPNEIQEYFALADGKNIISVDVPSGGSIATAMVSAGTPHATRTVTFGACKIGHLQYPLKGYCGKVHVRNIGIEEKFFKQLEYPLTLMDDSVAKEILPARKPDSHKGNYGKLLSVTGCAWMPGACLMSTIGALRCGVGIVAIATPISVVHSISVSCPEAIYIPTKTDSNGYLHADNAEKIIEYSEQCSAILIGCGLGVTDGTKALVSKLLTNLKCPIILDADGINCIAEDPSILKKAKAPVILTPHPGEMARLMKKTAGEVQENRLQNAIEFAKEYKVIIVLKGAGSIIASPKTASVNITGNAGMSKGGTGDILAGMTASFIAQGIDPYKATCLAVFIHGRAGDLASMELSPHAMLPTDLLKDIPGVFLQLEESEG